MQYIIMDLEWNQPLSHHSMPFKRVGDKLMFELIQIGAVKLDEERRLVGSFNRHIMPTHYKKLNPRIRRITGIQQDDLDGAPYFKDALEQFVAWCSEDFVLMTWGCDDISVLAQNMAFFGFDDKLPPVYDLQPLFGRISNAGKNRHSLRKAIAYYGIRPSADHAFHSAVDDAYYTALVFQRLPAEEDIKAFPEAPRKLGQRDRVKKKAAEKRVATVLQGLSSSEAMFPACPVCARKTVVTEGYIPQSEEGFHLALSDCEQHGLIKSELQFVPQENGGFAMLSRVSLSEQQHPAYVRTKHIQWAQKVQELKEKESQAC